MKHEHAEPSRPDVRAARLADRLDAIAAEPGHELPSLSFAAFDADGLLFERSIGRRRIDPDHPENDLPVTADTRYRIASISKPFVGVAAMRLADRGLLDLDADASDYLGWRLRNPAYPDAAITPAMLLAHTSSLRDGSGYSLPPERPLSDFFTPGAHGYTGDHWGGGGRAVMAPGLSYCYCNLGFGVMGTIIERITGRRFDEHMKADVLEPLGLAASFNVRTLSDEAFANLATLYRRGEDESTWRPDGPWVPQVDDYRGARPVGAVVGAGPDPAALAGYAVGTNGTLFSPQGGLRASARETARLGRLLLGRGSLDGRRLLSEAAWARMTADAWTWDRALMNAELGEGNVRKTGLALLKSTDCYDEFGGDRIGEPGRFDPPVRVVGHSGNAWGLLGGLFVVPEAGLGFTYLMGGTATDPELRKGQHCSYALWQEEIHDAAAEYLFG